jgi:hypothetical protein
VGAVEGAAAEPASTHGAGVRVLNLQRRLPG